MWASQGMRFKASLCPRKCQGFCTEILDLGMVCISWWKARLGFLTYSTFPRSRNYLFCESACLASSGYLSLQFMRKYELWLKLFHGWDLFYLHCPMNSHNRLSLQHLDLLVRATNRISEILFLWEFCLCQAIFNWAGDSSRCWGRTRRCTPSQPAQAPLQHFHGKQSPSSVGLYWPAVWGAGGI